MKRTEINNETLLVFTSNEGCGHFSQRNNELVWPSVKAKPKAQYRTNWLNMCNATSMINALCRAGYSLPDGRWKQPEDNLAEFILTNKELLNKWRTQAPAQYDLFIKSLDGQLTEEQVKKHLYFPNELHDYLSLGTNLWIGTTATRFYVDKSFKQNLMDELVFDDCPIVISTTFGGMGHIVCCTGVAYNEVDESSLLVYGNTPPTPAGIIVDDPWGKYNPETNTYDAPSGGNDIFIPWDVVVKRVKPAGSTDTKWMHLFFKGLPAV